MSEETVDIEHELLCDFCKNHHDCSMNMCEGSECSAMREMYLEHHGIDYKKRTFSDLKPSDAFYSIRKEDITRLIVDRIALYKDYCGIRANNATSDIEVKPNENISLGEASFYIELDDAIKDYEAAITKKTVAMFTNLAKIKSDDLQIKIP